MLIHGWKKPKCFSCRCDGQGIQVDIRGSLSPHKYQIQSQALYSQSILPHIMENTECRAQFTSSQNMLQSLIPNQPKSVGAVTSLRLALRSTTNKKKAGQGETRQVHAVFPVRFSYVDLQRILALLPPVIDKEQKGGLVKKPPTSRFWNHVCDAQFKKLNSRSNG